ncbi:MAG: TRAP transporter small permease [Fusobacteriaceae bacterium]|jgi:TRAP-type C4-dicarboxylate transport system permease small subunit|nr:TRAP transporter small permease [Fusobacteriaceae bacterium]
MGFLKKLDAFLNGLRLTALVLITAVAVGIAATNIVLRYFIRSFSSLRPFAWGDELLRMCAIWLAFLAASLGVKENSHISIQFLVEKFVPKRFKSALDKVAQLTVLAVLAVLVGYGIKVTLSMRDNYLQNIALSTVWFYAAIPIGCAFLFYDYLLIFLFGEHPFSRRKSAGRSEKPKPAGEDEPC